ncbi:MAG: hypothetical protein OXC66_12100, partial [Roseovarius sp.]|nr:hypothetical protein [Roseovarius sp.]
MARNRTREIPLLKNLATLESALDANDVRDASEGQIRPFLVAEKLQYNAANGTALVQDVSFSV